MVERRREFSCWLKLPLQLHSAETAERVRGRSGCSPPSKANTGTWCAGRPLHQGTGAFPGKNIWKILLILCISPTFLHPIQRLSLTVTRPLGLFFFFCSPKSCCIQMLQGDNNLESRSYAQEECWSLRHGLKHGKKAMWAQVER